MPCAKLNLTNDIFPSFKKKINNNYIYFSGSKNNYTSSIFKNKYTI